MYRVLIKEENYFWMTGQIFNLSAVVDVWSSWDKLLRTLISTSWFRGNAHKNNLLAEIKVDGTPCVPDMVFHEPP